MICVLLDSNIYDKLAVDPEMIAIMNKKIAEGRLIVIVSPIIMDELKKSKFGGVPDFFPFTSIPEAVAAADYARADKARVGDGFTYEAHRGDSNKAKDAIIAETADSNCDIFVSEDKRCRVRLDKHAKHCKALDYEQFKRWLGAS